VRARTWFLRAHTVVSGAVLGDDDPMRAVVVDDHAGFRGAAVRLLDAIGFDVVEVADTLAEGRRSIGESAPDFVLIDVGLPDGNGFDLADELVESYAARSLVAPVIVVTSSRSEREYGARIARAPSIRFIAKDQLSADGIRSCLPC
jgi:DNA-binding NarL/FixJ family response regulator